MSCLVSQPVGSGGRPLPGGPVSNGDPVNTLPIRLRRLSASTIALLAALALSAAGPAVAATAPNTAGQSTTSLRNTSTVSAQSLAQMVAGAQQVLLTAAVDDDLARLKKEMGME